MGLLDDAVPGGNIGKPLLIALGVLLAGKMFGQRSAGQDNDNADREQRVPPQQIPEQRSPQIDTRTRQEAERVEQPSQTGRGDGGILDGLGDLLDNLAKQGKKETADSWVQKGPNQPIEPDDLGKAIGNTTLRDIARQTGMSEEELLRQLSKILPGMVDKLTPAGRVPSNGEVAEQFPSSPW